MYNGQSFKEGILFYGLLSTYISPRPFRQIYYTLILQDTYLRADIHRGLHATRLTVYLHVLYAYLGQVLG